MPYYSVIIEGTGISMDGGEGEIGGFFTTRTVRAKDEPRAIERAKAVLAREWATEPLKSLNKGEPPKLRYDSIRQLNIWRVIFKRYINGGHAFYPKDEGGH